MRRRQRGTPPAPAPAPAAAPPPPPPGYRVGAPTQGDVAAAAEELGLDNADISWALRRWEINDSPIREEHLGEEVVFYHETNRTSGAGARRNRRDGTSNMTFFYVRGEEGGEYYLVAWGNHRTGSSYRVEGAVAGFAWLVGRVVHF